MSDEELIRRVVHDIGHYAAYYSMQKYCRLANIPYHPNPEFQLHHSHANKQKIAALIEKGNKNQLSGLELAYYQSYQYGLQQLKHRQQIHEFSPDIAKRVIDKLHLSTLQSEASFTKQNRGLETLGLFCCLAGGLVLGSKISPYLFPRK